MATATAATPVEILDVNFRPIMEARARRQHRPVVARADAFCLDPGFHPCGGLGICHDPTRRTASRFPTAAIRFLRDAAAASSTRSFCCWAFRFPSRLLGILFAHEMGHYIACRIYGIDVSYPYFIPAPTLFGTFGAFIRIRSPITTRRALFDVGIAGPVVGFLIAAPAMAYAIATSRVVPGVQSTAQIVFGHPPLMRFFIELFHPACESQLGAAEPGGSSGMGGIFCNGPEPAAALATGWRTYRLQLDQPARTSRISILVAFGLLLLGRYAWSGWYLWGGVLLILSLRFGHPPVLDRWEELDASRKLWADRGVVEFSCCASRRRPPQIPRTMVAKPMGCCAMSFPATELHGCVVTQYKMRENVSSGGKSMRKCVLP